MPLPAHGKNSRGGRRGSAASSSSYTSTITMAVFVGLCLLGVYKLTSSTSTISHPPHHHLQRNAVSSNQSPPRSVLRDNPSSDPLDDTQGELPEDAVKGDETSQENQEKVRSQSVGTTEEDVAAAAAAAMVRPQQEEEVETNRVSEEIKQQQDQNQENGRINAEEQQQMSEGELGANHEGTLQIIEQVTSGNHDAKSEEVGGGGDKDIDNQSLSGQIPKSEDGEDKGITSQSQIEHDADGTTDNQQQQQQQQDEQQQQQQEEEQQKLEQQQQQQQQQEEEQQQQQQEEEQQPQQQQQVAGENNQQVEENPNPSEAIPDESKVAVPDKSNGDKKTWEMQADQSSNEKEKRDENEPLQSNGGGEGEGEGDSGKLSDQGWELCNVTAGPDYIPCLDNEKAIKQLRSFRHYEHRERHCPDESPTCLVPLPNGYKRPIEWPQSRDRVKARV